VFQSELKLNVSCIFKKKKLKINETLTSNITFGVMSGNLSFHFSLTIISYARHLTISTYQTTALGEYSFLKSKLIVDWSVENISVGPSWP